MSRIRVVALPTEVADKVRVDRVSPFAEHPVHREVATGYGPCRHCLRDFEVGEEARLLLTYDPFCPLDAPPLPGPVFVHEEPCERWPEDGGMPEDPSVRRLTLNAYGRPRRLVAQVDCLGRELDAVAGPLLERDGVDFIHVRDAVAGCYDFRLERAP